MVIGSLSLLATPFLTGFYSKDLIIELAYAKYSFTGTFSYYLLSITAGLTAFYSFRLIMLTFLTIPNGSKLKYLNVHESSLIVIISLSTLSIFSIFFGYLFSDLFIGIGNNAFSSSMFIHPNNINLVEAEFSLPLLIKLLPAILSALGALLAIIFYQNKPELFVVLTDNSLGKSLYTFLNGKYFFDIIYNFYIIRKSLQYGYYITNVLEKGIIETMGPHGLSNVLYKTGINISKLDTGIVTSYALYIVLGLISLIFLVFFPLIVNISGSYSDPLLILELRLFIVYVVSFILSVQLSSSN